MGVRKGQRCLERVVANSPVFRHGASLEEKENTRPNFPLPSHQLCRRDLRSGKRERVCVSVCVCVRERESELSRASEGER